MQIINGATRNVLLTRRYAFKIPLIWRRTARWRSKFVSVLFKQGFRANRLERKWAGHHPMLCPVLFADPWGLVVVMPRCAPLKQCESYRERIAYMAICPVQFNHLKSLGLPVDNYCFNYGYLPDGRLVSFDYGTLSEPSALAK